MYTLHPGRSLFLAVRFDTVHLLLLVQLAQIDVEVAKRVGRIECCHVLVPALRDRMWTPIRVALKSCPPGWKVLDYPMYPCMLVQTK